MKIDVSKGRYWDRIWRVTAGCTHVSPGCAQCWSAKESAVRSRQTNPKISAQYGDTFGGLWTGKVRCLEDNLRIPLETRKPTAWLLLNDPWHKDVLGAFLDKMFAVMALCPQHTFLCLTKRAERQARYLARERCSELAVLKAMHQFQNGLVAGPLSWPLRNVRLGVSAENQECLDERAPHLVRLGAAGWPKCCSETMTLDGPEERCDAKEAGR